MYTINYLKNLSYKSVGDKVLVIECDDWGSIRMPSLHVKNELEKVGCNFTNRYDNFDCLESNEDLDELQTVLANHKDVYGNSAVLTAFFCVANLDHKKIIDSGFQKIHYIIYDELARKESSELICNWKNAINRNLLSLEYHGFIHINIPALLQVLERNDDLYINAFAKGYFYTPSSFLADQIKSLRPELFYYIPDEFELIRKNLINGIAHFKRIFEVSPTVFAPTNGIYTHKFNEVLFNNGINYIYLNWVFNSVGVDGVIKKKFHNIRMSKKNNPRFYSRNCYFEPSDQSYNGIELTLSQIDSAFKANRPAIISTHRVNFVGGLSKINRDIGLNELNKLLTEVKKRWQDIQFLSSSELLKKIF